MAKKRFRSTKYSKLEISRVKTKEACERNQHQDQRRIAKRRITAGERHFAEAYEYRFRDQAGVGLILDSSIVVAGERRGHKIPQILEHIWGRLR